ncbi:MAG: hypothetical protein Q8P92_00830 [Candidatus Daviesbacteria bacterium]|nr:hypothetical protein [Candidatus Daviesbacteria bacterium]
MNSTLHVRIVTISQLVYEGDVFSVSSKNSQGKFDILKDHANFVTIIENEPIIINNTDHPDITYRFPLAILFTSKNAVNIYAYPQAHE